MLVPVGSCVLQIMPPRRSSRQKRPPVKANGGLPSKRARPTNDDASSSAAAVASLPSVPQEVSLPAGFIDQLVSKVADELERRSATPMSSGDRSASASLPGQADALSAVPLASPAAAPVCQMPDPATMASSLVQQSVGATQQLVAGELIEVPAENRPSEVFQSCSLPVDARLSDKIRGKIWNNEFVDFNSLVMNPVHSNQFRLAMRNADGDAPSLCIEPLSRAKRPQTIEAWISSFHIFVGVYTSKYPHEAPSLMKYGEVVQDLAARGHNWRYYDENFRYLRQRQPASFPWANIHWELWLRSQHQPSKSSPAQSSSKGGSGPLVPRGFCFRFHRGLVCAGCNFKHACFHCDGRHRATNCNFRASGKKQVQPKGAKSQTQQTGTPYANASKGREADRTS